MSAPVVMRKVTAFSLLAMLVAQLVPAQGTSVRNKEIAQRFYEDLWFSDHTDRYADHVADEYVIHDIGGLDGATEPAAQQKDIADFLHANGAMSGRIDYQIAEGDLVATRWYWTYRPASLLGRFLIGDVTIPIINVFRIEDGKIREIWNHRHDIDTNRTNVFLVKGLGIGLLVALVPLVWAMRLRRRLKRLRQAT
ncbi:MAG TPA: ester cyclase [Planctomycetota bacterium]|nr:ester cyclase [Planctomycetota bacterium]